MTKTIIAPSILAANLACLGQEVTAVLQAGADWIHFDVMDNHYVPALTFGPLVCRALRQHGVTAPIDVHLMTCPIERLLGEFVQAGASSITFHPATSTNVAADLQLIRQAGCQAGLAFNPGEPCDLTKYDTTQIDLILLMTVMPGAGGQTFIPSMWEKIVEVKTKIAMLEKPIQLAVDGGVTINNVGELARRGVDVLVAGSAIFKANDYATAITTMRQAINNYGSAALE